jgi:nucleotide-binding universal stress UspA family protein
LKIVCGIDPHQSSENLVHLLGRLRLPQAEVVCASIAPLPISSSPGLTQWPDELLPQVLDAERATADLALERTKTAFARYPVQCEEVFEMGDPSHHLVALAESRGADLIAIGSREVGPGLAFLLGSVGRALAIDAKCSLLIAKGPVEAAGPLRALFAYDASDFCERSVDELARIRPHGLAHVDLLIVDTPEAATSPVTRLRGDGAFELGEEHRHDLLLEYAEAAVARLRAAGLHATAHCLPGEIEPVIREAVVDLHSDLVILGAQGHGWLERTLYGSVVLAQAVSEPHSVWVLRPR